MLDLRGSAYIVLASAEGDDGGRTPPVLALARLVRNLADLHRNGRLVGALERPPQPHDRRKMLAEILASFLRGQLSPRDAETEIAVTDLLEETGRVAGDALRMFSRWRAALPECRTMTAAVLIHPAAGMPPAVDELGQGWLPPLWLWPESPWLGCWEYQHEAEYLVRIGVAASIGEAYVMLVDVGLAYTAAWRRAGAPGPPPPLQLSGRINFAAAKRWARAALRASGDRS